MKIGLISDTHGYLNPRVIEIFSDVEVILHAGDVGNTDVLQALCSIAPVEAVYGNVDDRNLRSILPPQLSIDIEAIPIFIVHDIGTHSFFLKSNLFKRIEPKPAMVIYGHTHVPSWLEHEGILFVNPGSASKPQKPQKPTVMKMVLQQQQITEKELIPLL